MQIGDLVSQKVTWDTDGVVVSCALATSGTLLGIGTEGGVFQMKRVAGNGGGSAQMFQSRVECCSFDGGEARVMVGSASGSMKLYDIAAERVCDSFPNAHRTVVSSIACYPLENNLFASGSADTNVKLWDTRRTQPLHTLKGSSSIKSLGISPDEKWVISGDETGKLSFIDVRTWGSVGDFRCESEITAIKTHPLELLLAAATTSGTVELFDVNSPRCNSIVRMSPPRPVWSVDLVPGENQKDYMITSSAEGLRVHSTSNTLLSSFDFSWNGTILASSYVEATGDVLQASARDSHLTLWAVSTNKLHKQKAGVHTHQPQQLALPFPVAPVKIKTSSSSSRSELVRNPQYKTGLIPMEPRTPLDLDLSRWRGVKDERSEVQIATELHATGEKMERLLRVRVDAMKVVRGMWASGDRTGAIKHAEKMAQTDFGVALDLLTIVVTQHKVKDLLTMEQCSVLLQLITTILRKGVDTSSIVAIRALRLLFNKFCAQIQRVTSAPLTGGVDLTGEARLARARECHQRFHEAKNVLLSALQNSGGQVSEEGRKILRDLETF